MLNKGLKGWNNLVQVIYY